MRSRLIFTDDGLYVDEEGRPWFSHPSPFFIDPPAEMQLEASDAPSDGSVHVVSVGDHGGLLTVRGHTGSYLLWEAAAEWFQQAYAVGYRHVTAEEPNAAEA